MESEPLVKKHDQPRLQRYQILVYLVTFIAYAMSHFSRKSYTYFKQNMRDQDGMSVLLQGRLDSSFMFAYAIGSFFSGNLGDRMYPPSIICFGLLGSGLCVALLIIGLDLKLLTDVDLPSYVAPAFFIFIWLIHGLFQSTGGPVNTIVMGNWFSKKNRGLIFGTWTCHQYSGNILGALVASALLANNVSYHIGLMIPVVCNIFWGLVVYYVLPSRPEQVDLVIPSDEPEAEHDEEKKLILNETHENQDQPPPITILGAFQIPSVAMYAFAFGFFKLTNYTLFFWLPFFLTKYFTPTQANLISILYDIGMMPGGILTGYISDLLGGRRATVCGAMLLLLCPLLLFFGWYADQMPVLVLLTVMGFMGILVGGPNNIITSAVAADLALHPSIKGNNRALGTVTGIINGSGSITAALGLLFVTWLQESAGWIWVWYFLVLATATGVLLMSPKIKSEIFSE